MESSFDISLAGKIIDKNPTITASEIKTIKDRHQIRIGNKLKNVINKRKQAIESLHIEFAKIGVNKNKRIQQILILGSMTRSQPDLPETY